MLFSVVNQVEGVGNLPPKTIYDLRTLRVVWRLGLSPAPPSVPNPCSVVTETNSLWSQKAFRHYAFISCSLCSVHYKSGAVSGQQIVCDFLTMGGGPGGGGGRGVGRGELANCNA